MKELEQHLKKQERVEVVAQQQKEFQKLLTGIIHTKRGHKVWQIDLKTMEVKEAELDNTVIDFELAVSGDLSKKREVITKEGFIYIPALNAKNAMKKFVDCPHQNTYFKKEPILNFRETH